MAVIKRENPYIGLKDLDIFIEDTVFDSQYFRVLECPTVLSQGKSSFLIGGSSYLKPYVELKFELVHDLTNEVIYTEAIFGHSEGGLRRVSIEVYSDVIPGPATLYVVGELNPSEVDIPSEWQGIYNVRWTKQISINAAAVNTEPIFFYKQPKITVSEIFRGYLNVPTITTSSVYLTGSGVPRSELQPILPSEGGTTYPELDFANKSSLSIIEENKPINKLTGKKGHIVAQGSLLQTNSPVPNDYLITVDSTSTVDSLYVGHDFTINNPQVNPSTFLLQDYHSVPTVYTSSVMKVLDETTFVPSNVFYINDTRTSPPTLVPAPLDNQFITASYQELSTQTTSSINYFSFADIQLSDLRSWSGDVHKVKIYAKGEGSLGDFEQIYDSPIESSEIFFDSDEDTLLGNMGYFIDQTRLDKYWESYQGSDGNGGSGTLTYHKSYIMDSMEISGSNRERRDELRIQVKNDLNFVAGNVYTFRGKLYGIKTEKIDGEGNLNSTGEFKIYTIGDAFNKDTNEGSHWGVEKLSVPDFPDGSTEHNFGYIEGNFTADNTGTGKIQFKVPSGKWYLSDISVKAASDTAFHPDYVQINAPMTPLYTRPDNVRFLAEFYDVNNNIADSVIFSDDILFQGENVAIGGTDNILSGSMVIGSALGSGIEMAGVGSGFVRSIGYLGYTKAINGSGGPGFLMWSGSVLPDSGDSYTGVGLELIGSSESYFRFRTDPSELDIRANAFFVGSETSQFISGSGGNIEISSSNFHVDPGGDVTMTGTVTADAGNIGNWQIIDGKLSGSNATLDAVGAALYKTDTPPDTNPLDGYYIDFTPGSSYYIRMGSDFAVSSSGQLFASGALIEGVLTASEGYIAQWTIAPNTIHKFTSPTYTGLSSIGDTRFFAGATSLTTTGSAPFNVKSTGDITGSSVLFDGGTIGGTTIDSVSLYSSDKSLVISGSGQITGSTVLFTGGKIAGFDISGTKLQQGTSFYLDGDSGGSYFISSSNFQVTPSGDVSGSQVLFTGGKIAGFTIDGTQLKQGTSFYLDGDSGGTYFISASNFQVTPGGSVTAVEGSIAGWTIDDVSMTGGDMIIRKDGTIESSGFASNVAGSGFRLTAASGGFLEVENAKIRGTLATAVFEKETVNAVGGQLYVANSTTLTGSVENPGGFYSATEETMSVVNVTGFTVGEILSAKKVSSTGFGTEYLLVESASRSDTSSETDYSGKLYVTRGYGSGVSGDSGSLGDTPGSAQEYTGSQVIVSTGKINTGYIRLNANPNDPTTPYIDIVERSGSGIYDVELKARLGDLSGLSSGLLYGETSPGFGLFSENVFLQGAITAQTGSFTGIVHAGSLRIGTNVNSTYDGIFINTNNYWYDTGDFKVGDGTSFVSSSGEIQTDKFELRTDRVKVSSTYASMSIGNDPTLTSGTGIFLSGSGEFRLGDDDGNIKFVNDSFSLTGADVNINVNQLNISASGFTLSSPQASMSLGNNDEILLHATGGTGGVPIFKLDGGEISASNFFVDVAGNLTASNATFQGIISSSEANIGGWTVDEGAVYKGVTRLSSSAEPGLYIEDSYGNPMVLIAEKSMYELGSAPDEAKNDSFEVTQSGEDTAGYHLGTSASPLTVHSWSFSSTGPISHSITRRSGSGFEGFNAAVLGDFTFDVIHPGQIAPIAALSRSFGDASASYLSGNTYEFTQIVSASQAAGNIWTAGNVVSFAGVAKMSHSFAGAGVDRGFQKQKYKVDYWSGTEWITFIPKSQSRSMRADGFAHYNLGQRYSSIAGAGALPASSDKLRITLTGSINPDTSYTKTTYLYQGALLDPMQSAPSNGVDINEIIVLNTTESAKYPYTEITFDNFRLRQSQPRVELSPDGFLLYSSDNSYLKMTPEGIDFKGGQGFSQTSTMLSGETNSDNIDVYGSLAAPSLQAYEGDPANVSTTGFQGNVNEFAMGNHRHALEFSTVNAIAGTFTNGTWNSTFGGTANSLISGSWLSQGFTVGGEVSGSWQGYITGSGIVSHSQFNSPSQGTVRATLNGVTTDVDTGLQTGDTPTFSNVIATNDIFAQGLYVSSSASTNVIQVGADGTGGIQKWEWHRDGTRKWLIYNDGRTDQIVPQDSMVFKHGLVTDGDDHINFHMEPDDQTVYFHGDISQSSGTIYGDILEIQKGATFNTDQSPAYDFEVRSQNLNHMLYVDSNYDKVGIGFNSPGGKHLSSSLHIAGDITATHVTASGDISASGELSAATVSDVLAAAVVTQIDNDEIPIAKLASDSVSYGGVSVTLGASDTTPAFDLQHATAYPGDSSLVTTGTVTNGVWNSTFGGTSNTIISGSLGTNASLIRSLTATGISGSLGTNASLIRSLTATGITGSSTSLSSSLASRLSTEEGNVDTLQSTLSTEQGYIDTLQSTLSTEQGYIDTLQSASASLSTRVTTEEANVDTLQSTLSTEQGYIDTLQAASGSFSTRVTTEEANVDTLQSTLSTEQGYIDTLQSTLATEQGYIDTLQTASASLSTRVTTEEGNVDTLQSTLATEQGYIDTLQSTLSTEQGYIDTLQAASGSFSTRVTTEEANVDALQAITLTAGVGLSGGGTLASDRTFTVDLTEFSTVTPTNGDLLLTLDSDGSTEQNTAVSELATLYAGTGLTATNSVIAVDYGSSAGDAVEGDTTLTLTGATNEITIDAGSGANAIGSDTAITIGLADTIGGARTFSDDIILSDGEGISSTTYNSGFAGSGWKIDEGISIAGKTSAEFDNLTVRGTMSVYEMLIHQVRATNGSIWVSNTGKILSASFEGGAKYTLFFDSGSQAGHGFMNADSIRSQRWSPTGELYQSDLFVVSTDNTGSLTAYLSGSSDAPIAGYEYVRIGNISGSASSSRQGAIYLTSDDSNAPYIDVIDGVTHHGTFNTSGNIKTRMGKLSGITSATLGALSGYGFYASGSAYLEGTINATAGGYIGGWSINKDSITKSTISLNSTVPSLRISDATRERLRVGDLNGVGGYSSTQYGIIGFDGTGTTASEVLFELSDNRNVIADWAIAPGSIQYDSSGGSLALAANSQSLSIFTGSLDFARPKLSLGKLPNLSGDANQDRYGLGVFTGTADADITDDTTYTVLITRDKARLAGWDLIPGNIQSDNTVGSVRLSSVSQSLTIWTGSVDEAEPKLVLGKLPLHDGTVDSPYGFAVFSGTGTVSGSEASASVLITANKARLAGWELEPGELRSGTVAKISGNSASIALGTGASTATATPTAGLFFVSASSTPVFYVGADFSYVNNTLTAAGWTIGTDSISKGGVSLTSTTDAESLRIDKTSYSHTAEGIFIGNDSGSPRVNIGTAYNYLKWTGTAVEISGSITATTGTIGGWSVGANSLTSTNIGLHSAGYSEGAELLIGHATAYASAEIGFKADGSGKLASGNIVWTSGGDITFGSVSSENIHITSGGDMLFRNATTTIAEMDGTTWTIGGPTGTTADAVVIASDSVTIYGNDSSTGVFITDDQVEIKSDADADKITLDNNGMSITAASQVRANFGTTVTLGYDQDAYMTLANDALKMFDEGGVQQVELNTGTLTLGGADGDTSDTVVLDGGSVTIYGNDSSTGVFITDNQIEIKSDADADKLTIDNDGMTITANSKVKSAFHSTGSTFYGDNLTTYAKVTSTGLTIVDNDVTQGTFNGGTVTLFGGSTSDKVEIDSDGLLITTGGVPKAAMHDTGSTFYGDNLTTYTKVTSTGLTIVDDGTTQGTFSGGTVTLFGGSANDKIEIDSDGLLITTNAVPRAAMHDTGSVFYGDALDTYSRVNSSGMSIVLDGTERADIGSDITLTGGTITLLSSAADKLIIDSSGFELTENSQVRAIFGATSVIGSSGAAVTTTSTNDCVRISDGSVKLFSDASNYTDITASGSAVWGGGAKVAVFGATTTVGITANNDYVSIESDGVKVYGGSSTSYTHVSGSGMSVFNGSVNVASFGPNVRIGPDHTSKSALRVDSSGNLTIGVQGAGTPAVSMTNAGVLTIAGAVNASSGNFSGQVYVGATNNRIVIDGANKKFYSETTGFDIRGSGYASFAAGQIVFNADGSGTLGSSISWTSAGLLTVNRITATTGVIGTFIIDSENIYGEFGEVTGSNIQFHTNKEGPYIAMRSIPGQRGGKIVLGNEFTTDATVSPHTFDGERIELDADTTSLTYYTASAGAEREQLRVGPNTHNYQNHQWNGMIANTGSVYLYGDASPDVGVSTTAAADTAIYPGSMRLQSNTQANESGPQNQVVINGYSPTVYGKVNFAVNTSNTVSQYNSTMETISISGYTTSATDGVAIGIKGKAVGGATNWAGYFDSGNVKIENNLIVDDFASLNAARIGATETDPGVGNLYVEGNITSSGDVEFGSKTNNTVRMGGGVFTTSGISTSYGNLTISTQTTQGEDAAHMFFASADAVALYTRFYSPIYGQGGYYDIEPVDASQDLGATDARWRNVYTTDLQLSNMDRDEGNEIDGTKGDWTLQEGDEDLFVINNISGKKYKIALIPTEEDS